MLIEAMKSTKTFKGTFIGCEEMLLDRGARILEVTEIGAAAGFSGMIEEAVVISHNEVLMYTADSMQDWEARLTEALVADPATAGTAVRWRKCTNGGRIWAKPKVADEVTQAAVRRARRPATAKDEDEKGEVRLRGPLGAAPEKVLEAVMEAIKNKTGTRWRAQTDRRTLDRYCWRVMRGHDGRPSGKIVTEVDAIYQAVHNDIVKVNGTMIPVEIYSEALAASRLRPSS